MTQSMKSGVFTVVKAFINFSFTAASFIHLAFSTFYSIEGFETLLYSSIYSLASLIAFECSIFMEGFIKFDD